MKHPFSISLSQGRSRGAIQQAKASRTFQKFAQMVMFLKNTKGFDC